MNAKLQGRVAKLEGMSGVLRNDEWFREQLRLYFTTSVDVDAIPAGKAGEVYFAAMGREVF